MTEFNARRVSIVLQGEKNEGFNVLYQNMKCGTLAAKELTDFFRESAKLEEENAKTHAKLAKQVHKYLLVSSLVGATFQWIFLNITAKITCNQ